VFGRPTIALAVAVAGLIAAGGGEALAAPVACGDRIKVDTKLENDLVNCPNTGIVIAADNVTLDLDGHTIDGDGRIDRSCSGRLCGVGVAVNGTDGVRIEDGRVRQFSFGVVVNYAHGVDLRRLVATHSRFFGIGILQARDADLRRLTASRNGDIGLLMASVTHGEVRRSSINANGLDTDQAGLGLFNSRRVRIRRNTISRNGDIGLISEGAYASRIHGNRVADNPEAAILLSGNRNAIRHNRILRNGDGIIIGGNRNAISRNHISRAVGCDGGCGAGIAVEAGDENRIARNLLTRARESGIRVGLDPEIVPDPPRVTDTIVRGNRVRRSKRDGVTVEPTATATVLRRNRARGSRDDGFDVEDPATTLVRNFARHNGELGIQAAGGVIDGGGNRASRNGDPRQCVNVTCR